MTEPDFKSFDHNTHIERAFELARNARDRGDGPFGSVLVRDDEIIMEASNRTVTENDLRRHPELHLAFRATQELDEQERAETMMYTSAEPCAMCSGGIRRAGLGGVVYSVSAEDIEQLRGHSSPIRTATVVEDEVQVMHKIRNEDGLKLLEGRWTE